MFEDRAIMEETQAAGAVSATVDNDFFKQMLDLIPVRFYFSKTTNKILSELPLAPLEVSVPGFVQR